MIRRYAKEALRGCPWDCGLCPSHLQHTCYANLKLTNRCNLDCPVCYMRANEGSVTEPSLAELVDMLMFLKSCEAEPPALQISGGEPTIREDLVTIVEKAYACGLAVLCPEPPALSVVSVGLSNEG